MRFLADAGISPGTVAFLTRLGHDAVHVRALAMHRAQDRERVEYARSETLAGPTYRTYTGLGVALEAPDGD